MNHDLIPKPITKFYRVKCQGCGNEQTIFSAASTRVKCLQCNRDLAAPTSSKVLLKSKVLKEFD
ncbi:MAG TPA: 30S ribosomal protein S27e [Candidatus Diapherotrites archaeon]|uniref:Small ribosomal subunit protein eS27 n=1 Tax=Candidatus Iainarchaeum sp. TaxID=3101447 RepID=A0A7J4IY27_9ARCH|nr:30S ribosomal protein S27e [Candidatus Diapherotrites archaeon]